jgi:hypothetical protein
LVRHPSASVFCLPLLSIEFRDEKNPDVKVRVEDKSQQLLASLL